MVNELTTDSRAALIDGVIDVVIATPLAHIARSAVKAMIDAIDGVRDAPSVTGLGASSFDLYTAENV